MSHVRLGIVGLGNIGKFHAEYLLSGEVPRCELVAVSDWHASNLKPFQARGLSTYESWEEMIRSKKIEAILVATPHFLHTPIGIDALQNGVHAMIEKPISAHKADAERLCAVAEKHPSLVFAGMFQLRVEPRYLELRRLIRSELGRLVRVNWIITDWFRTEAYYASGGWRATWKGEGGGVLLNQCLHQLDMLQWLCGMPARVRGFCQLGHYHDIEVEDNVSCHLEWATGATGVELTGTRGRVVLEGDRITFDRNAVDMSEFSRVAVSGFAKPEVTTMDMPFESIGNAHAVLVENFVSAILDKSPLIAPGGEGIGSVELANALLYSSILGETMELPMSGGDWEVKLNELIAGSHREKKVVKGVVDDFRQSFRK
ncbi:MAG: Gfo/Idh/MocA family oxidoreductase [Verrucomicrobia bacterium]|nr:Gfo/Idh/MocA family oxidoreductase [Verrucomicrobiota bacterium]